MPPSCPPPIRTHRLRVSRLRTGLVRALVEKLGVGEKDARVSIDHLVRAEQAGKKDHGLIRVRYLLTSGKFGPFSKTKTIEPSRRKPGLLHVDGAERLGYAVMADIVESGCREAEENGTCVVIGSHIYPSGCLGDWARTSAHRGCASLWLASSPPRVAPPFGKTPVVGTNPLCVGLPTEPFPFVSDCSTSAITHGQLLLANRNGESLPAGSAVDSHGNATTLATDVDPTKEKGALLPEGNSHKFFATALAIELLTSLGECPPGSSDPGNQGVFCLFLGSDTLTDRIDPLSSWLRSLTETDTRIPGWHDTETAHRQFREDEVHITEEGFEALRTALPNHELARCEIPSG